ncbi:MAG: hypothetical protein WC440_05770 [Candidatus Omnitrophota bacterium]
MQADQPAAETPDLFVTNEAYSQLPPLKFKLLGGSARSGNYGPYPLFCKGNSKSQIPNYKIGIWKLVIGI